MESATLGLRVVPRWQSFHACFPSHATSVKSPSQPIASPMNADIRLLLWVQAHAGESTYAFWNFVTAFGGGSFIVLLIGLTLWHAGTKLGLRLMIAAVLGTIAMDLLKIAFAEPRPYYEWSQVYPWHTNSGFGMPSGHAAAAVCVWGTVAAMARRAWVTWSCVGLIFLIGASRIYLGVHYPSQVVFGWLVGLVVLSGMERYGDRMASTFRSWRFTQQLTFAVACSGLILVAKWSLCERVEGNVIVPEAWATRYEQAQLEFASRTGQASPSMKPLAFYRPVRIDHVGAMMGLWLIIIYVARQGGLVPASRREQLSSVLLGGGFVVLIVVSLDAIRESLLIATTMAVITPFTLAIVVPSISARLHRGTLPSDHDDEQ